MIVIIGLWLVLLDKSIAGQKSDVRNQISEGASFWQVFKTGLKSVGGSGFDSVKNLYNQAIGGMFIEVER